MRSLWQSKTYVKNPSSPLNLTCVCKGGWDLSKEALWVSVGQLASKLQAVNVGGLPIGWPRATRVRIGRLAEFFSNLQHWQFVILMLVDLQRPTVSLWKDLNLLNKHKLNLEGKKDFNTSYALSKWPYSHRAYLIRGCISFWLAVVLVLN